MSGPGGGRTRPVAPPPVSRFPDGGAPLGRSTFGLHLGDLHIRLDGLDDDLATRLSDRFGPFASGAEDRPVSLRIAVGDEPVEYFIDPPERPEPNAVLVAVEPAAIRYLGHRAGGWFDPDAGRGVLRLSRGTWEPAERAVENFLRCAVAWLAIGRGGALVHAASLIRRGAGFLFYGHSGAGKSTLAASNRRGTVVSDDLSLVLPGEDGTPWLIGTPFRGTWEEGEPVVGRFPLRAGFRLVQAPEPGVVEVPRRVAFAGLVANLPFVVDALDARPGLLDVVTRAFADLPLLHLAFRPDDGFWDAIEGAGLLPDGP